jgi:choline dehydrogenase-like flavoprotein
MSNRYVSGCSVFPTAGGNFPTITVAALALRLSDHLAKELSSHNFPHDVGQRPLQIEAGA